MTIPVRMRRVVHRREAMAPVRKTALIMHKRKQAFVVVLGLGIEDGAELALARPFHAGDDLGTVVAGLGHHVPKTGALYRFEQSFEFLDGHAGGHGADDVLACLQGFDVHPDMQRQRGEDPHGIQLRMFEKLAEILVHIAAAVDLGEALQPVWTNVADRGDLAVGVQVPLEAAPEVPAHDPNSHLPAGAGLAWRGPSYRCRGGGTLEKAAATDSTVHRATSFAF